MNNKNKKIIIFDFDGTIADSLAVIVDVLNELSGCMHFNKIDKNLLTELQDSELKEFYLKKVRITKWKLPLVVLISQFMLHQRMKDMPLFPGMHESLLKLKEKYALGILTSNATRNVNEFLKINKLDMFDFVCSGNLRLSKSRELGKLLDRYGYAKEDVIYVGDEFRDIETAKKNNMKVISVTWGFNTRKVLEKSCPDSIVDSPEEFCLAVDKVFNSNLEN